MNDINDYISNAVLTANVELTGGQVIGKTKSFFKEVLNFEILEVVSGGMRYSPDHFADSDVIVDKYESSNTVTINGIQTAPGIFAILNNINSYLDNGIDFINWADDEGVKEQQYIELTDYLKASIKDLSSSLEVLQNTAPSSVYENYLDENKADFYENIYMSDFNEYLFSLSSILNNIYGMMNTENFVNFFKYHPDLLSNDMNYISDNANENVAMYKLKTFAPIINSIFNIGNTMRNDISNILGTSNINGNTLAFVNSTPSIKYPKIVKTENDKVVFGNNANYIYSLELINNAFGTYQQLVLDNEYTKFITNAILNNSVKTNIDTSLNDPTGSTICFWTKISADEINKAIAEIGLFQISFKLNGTEYKLILTVHSIELLKDSINVKTLSITQVDDFLKEHDDEWLLWEMHLNNTGSTSGDRTNYDLTFDLKIHYYDKEIEDYSFISPTLYKENKIQNFLVLSGIVDTLDETFFLDASYTNITLGRAVGGQFSSVYPFTGNIRNFMIIKGALTNIQGRSLYMAGLQSMLDFRDQYDESNIYQLIQNQNFFIGLIGSYDNTNINILNCVMKYNGKTFTIS